jgi:hypothetical protein
VCRREGFTTCRSCRTFKGPGYVVRKGSDDVGDCCNPAA